ncbi:peptidoglycan-binding protein [Actinomadura sp. 6N118]|uniref:peptidoglycan-binding protein n=1 Tax=Actinomadura sp. 6N118 TaxID=3375151 RepID=UPI0037B4725C
MAVAGIVTGGAAMASPASADTQTATADGHGFPQTLRQGDKGNEVLALQWMLNCRGYSVATKKQPKPPGHFGPTTKKQVTKFQQADGRAGKPDGHVGAATWHSLYTRTGIISRGAKSDCVRAVQVLLNKDTSNGKLRVDGQFGDRTAAKVRGLQKGLGLNVTGQVDVKTFHALAYYHAKDS